MTSLVESAQRQPYLWREKRIPGSLRPVFFGGVRHTGPILAPGAHHVDWSKTRAVQAQHNGIRFLDRVEMKGMYTAHLQLVQFLKKMEWGMHYADLTHPPHA